MQSSPPGSAHADTRFQRACQRTFAALAGAAVIALLASCGGGSDEPPEESATPGTAIPTATPFAVEPSPTIVSASTPAASRDVTYIVEPGDVLALVAERFEVTLEAIMERNGITNPELIFVGQELVIPGDASEPTPTPESEPGATDTYVVQPGDTALGIALTFDTTLDELATANGLTLDELTDLKIGQELVLPRPR